MPTVTLHGASTVIDVQYGDAAGASVLEMAAFNIQGCLADCGLDNVYVDTFSNSRLIQITVGVPAYRHRQRVANIIRAMYLVPTLYTGELPVLCNVDTTHPQQLHHHASS